MNNQIYKLNPANTLTIKGRKCHLILNKPYCNNSKNDMERYRIPYTAALIINNLDGTNTVGEIALKLAQLFGEKDQNYFESKVYELISMFAKAFLLLSEKETDVNGVYSDKYILQNVAIYDKSEFIIRRMPFPRQILLRVTNLCGRNCTYCYQRSYENEMDREYLSFERLSVLFHEAEQNGTQKLILTGGEPFHRKDIFDLIKLAADKSLKVYVSTKLPLDEKKLGRLKNDGLSELQFSVDTNDDLILEKLIGDGGHFISYKNSIRKALDLNLNVVVKAVITSLNIRTIPEYLRELIMLGVKHIKLSYYEMNCKSNDRQLQPEAESIRRLDSYMREIIQSAEINIEYDFFRDKMLEDKEYRDQHRKKCLALKDTIYIREDGKVLFCEMLMDYPDFIVGDLRNQSILDVWNSDEALLYMIPDKAKFRNSRCGVCDDFYTCFEKKCFMRTYAEYQDKFMPDPWCNKI